MQRREKKQFSGGNQKWSVKLMKQRCHRLVQLSFNSHSKAVLLFQQHFLLKHFCEIVTNLLEDLLHQRVLLIGRSVVQWRPTGVDKSQPADVLRVETLTLLVAADIQQPYIFTFRINGAAFLLGCYVWLVLIHKSFYFSAVESLQYFSGWESLSWFAIGKINGNICDLST